MADALHRCLFRREIKGACRAHRNAPNIRADFLAAENFCTNDVAGLEAIHPFGLFGPSSRKAIFVHAAHLPTPMPICRDEQWHHSLDKETRRRALADTGRIDPVGFLESL